MIPCDLISAPKEPLESLEESLEWVKSVPRGSSARIRLNVASCWRLNSRRKVLARSKLVK